MPFQSIDNEIQYAMINFDDRGIERADDPVGGRISGALLEQARRDKPTDVFLFSHGWKGDVPAAIDQYNRWIGSMCKLSADRAAMGAGFQPMFIGLHWPSQPWGEETAAAVAVGHSFGTAESPNIESLLDAAVTHFGGGEEVRKPLEVIFSAFQQNPAARVLPPEVVDAYHDLGRAIGFSAGSGPGAAPDEEGAALDPQAAVRAERLASAGQSFGIFSSLKNGILAGLRQGSFWLMKHRARTVGEQGMHQFVKSLQQTCDARIHLMGHSFGTIVVSSILGGPGGRTPLPRPVQSAALVQGAVSLWSFASRVPDSADPGYFHRVLSGAVKGPIMTTQSTNDRAVGLAYPAAVALVGEVAFGVDAPLPKFGGIGTWGIQGTDVAQRGTLLNKTAIYDLKPGKVHNLDGSAFIPDHSGIDGAEVAHALWQTALIGNRS